VAAGDIHEFFLANKEMLNSDDPDLDNDLAVKSILGLDRLKGAFLSDFDDEFNETSLVYGIAVYP
jgi:hypothetical protein